MTDSLFTLSPTEWLAHGLGILAMLFGFYAITLTDDQKLMSYTIITSLILIPHFFLLGSAASAISIALIAFRVWIAKHYANPQWLYFFMLLSAIHLLSIGSFTTELIPVITTAIATINYFYCRGVLMRFVFVCCTFLWIMNSLIVESWSSVFYNGVALFIHINTAVRIQNQNQNAIDKYQ